jgi:hypothetical protein
VRERGRRWGSEREREGSEGGRRLYERESGACASGLGGSTPVRVYIYFIYSTLGIWPGNGNGLGQIFEGGPYKITTSKNRFMETVVLRRPPP